MTGWLIQRTAPGEPAAFWGKHDCWVHRGPCQRAAEVLKPRIPRLAAVYENYDAAFDIAASLRDKQPMAHGEVIAVVSAPEDEAGGLAAAEAHR